MLLLYPCLYAKLLYTQKKKKTKKCSPETRVQLHTKVYVFLSLCCSEDNVLLRQMLRYFGSDDILVVGPIYINESTWFTSWYHWFG